jgi:hypothetical protein
MAHRGGPGQVEQLLSKASAMPESKEALDVLEDCKGKLETVQGLLVTRIPRTKLRMHTPCRPTHCKPAWRTHQRGVWKGPRRCTACGLPSEVCGAGRNGPARPARAVLEAGDVEAESE